MESIMGRKVNLNTLSMVKDNIRYALAEGLPYWDMDIRPQYSIAGTRYGTANTFKLLAFKAEKELQSDVWITEHSVAARDGSIDFKAVPAKIKTFFQAKSETDEYGYGGMVHSHTSLYNLSQTSLGNDKRERLVELDITWKAETKAQKSLKCFLDGLGLSVAVSKLHKTPFRDGKRLILPKSSVNNSDQVLFMECRVAAHEAADTISSKLLLSKGSILKAQDNTIARELAAAELYGAIGGSVEALKGYKAKDDAVRMFRKLKGEHVRLAYALTNSSLITAKVLKAKKTKKKK
jgi:hypothetical protein